ncbi:unnamed protein product [Boreogadus saida]
MSTFSVAGKSRGSQSPVVTPVQKVSDPRSQVIDVLSLLLSLILRVPEVRIRFEVDQSRADAAHTRIRLNINAGAQRDGEQKTSDKTPNQRAEAHRVGGVRVFVSLAEAHRVGVSECLSHWLKLTVWAESECLSHWLKLTVWAESECLSPWLKLTVWAESECLSHWLKLTVWAESECLSLDPQTNQPAAASGPSFWEKAHTGTV